MRYNLFVTKITNKRSLNKEIVSRWRILLELDDDELFFDFLLTTFATNVL